MTQPRPPSLDHERGTQSPLLPTLVVHGRAVPPGPTRRFHRPHFARMASGDAMALALIAIVAVYFVGADLGLLPDLFHWHR